MKRLIVILFLSVSALAQVGTPGITKPGGGGGTWGSITGSLNSQTDLTNALAAKHPSFLLGTSRTNGQSINAGFVNGFANCAGLGAVALTVGDVTTMGDGFRTTIWNGAVGNCTITAPTDSFLCTGACSSNVLTLVPGAAAEIHGQAGVGWQVFLSGGGIINSTNGVVPYRLNAGTFSDSPFQVSSGSAKMLPATDVPTILDLPAAATGKIASFRLNGTEKASIGSDGSLIAGDGTTDALTMAERAAPSNPSAGSCTQYVDSTSHRTAWLNSAGGDCGPSTGGLSGLTTSRIPKATSPTAIGDSSVSDNGTTVSTTEPFSVATAGVFTNSAGVNGNSTFLVNGLVPGTQWTASGQPGADTEALTGGVAVSNTSTAHQATAVAGYTTSANASTNAVGVYGWSNDIGAGARVWGGNFGSTCPNAFNECYGEEINVNNNNADATVPGIGGAATNISQLSRMISGGTKKPNDGIYLYAVINGGFPKSGITIDQSNQTTHGFGMYLVPATNGATDNQFVLRNHTNAANAWTLNNDGSQYSLASAYQTLTDGATITYALNTVKEANATVTLAGSRTLNITNPMNGGMYLLKIVQDGSGNHTLTLGTGCTWKVVNGGAGAITLSTAAGAIDILTFTYDGTNCYANLGKNYS